MKIDISIIIVNFNTADLLDGCLNSIFSSTDAPAFEIIVVDNNSTDDSRERIRNKYPSVHLICNSQNLGFAKGNNQGLAVTHGKYTFLLNPDTLLYPDTLRVLKKFMDETPLAGAVSPRTFLDPHHPLQVCSLKILTPRRAVAAFAHLPFPGKSRVLREVWKIDAGLWAASEPYQVEGLGGAAFFTRTDLLRSLGGLDERFFMGYEDTDLSCAIQKKHLNLYIHPNTGVVHFFGQAKKKPDAPDPKIYTWRYAPYQFIRKYFSLPSALTFKTTMFVDAAVQSCLSPFKHPSSPPLNSPPQDIILRWEGNNKRYFFEISNDRPFFDKFGAVLSEPEIRIPRRLIDRLVSGWWYWRVYGDLPELLSGGVSHSGRIWMR